MPRSADAPRALDPASAAAALPDSVCVPFAWMRMPGGSDRALIQVPVVLEGEPRVFQLDTGADYSYLYADSSDVVAGGGEVTATGSTRWTEASFGFAGRPERATQLVVAGRRRGRLTNALMSLTGAARTDGTLGLADLEGALTVLDYASQRFCRVESLPPALEGRIRWTGADIRNHKLFIQIEAEGQSIDGVFFDSGSSVFPLILDRSEWEAITGRSGDEPDNERLTTTSWGREMTMIGAPARGTMSIGGVALSRPTVYFNLEDPERFTSSTAGVAGLVGNRPFWDGAIVMDLRGAARFGVVR